MQHFNNSVKLQEQTVLSSHLLHFPGYPVQLNYNNINHKLSLYFCHLDLPHSFLCMLFYTITDGKDQVPISYFISALRKTGLHPSDPRLKECMENLQQAVNDSAGEVMMDRELFHRCVGGNIVLLIQAFRKKFIIPEFDVFAQKINEIYDRVQKQDDGTVADYIPQLAKFSPELWGMSLCTVDGQRHSVGDTKQPFCLQSCVKPLQYAIAVHEAGTEHIHRYVGMEPSGLKFNMLSLDDEDKPHNPMVNAGAIVISSLIKVCRSTCAACYKLLFIIYYILSDMIDALDFYFQLCSIEVTCESGSIIAATLANGGICPITGEHVLSAEAVRNTLSLMHSCGMYDFSGQMAFHVGLPAKSGVSGAVLLVIPNVMGVMCWSPPLDRVGNSVRGIHFCQELVSLFNFHNYDNLRHFVKKQDPRRQDGDDRNKSVFNLMFAAYSGDVSALRRFALSSMDMDLQDYDSRTALHIAAAEGELLVLFLILHLDLHSLPCRWGNLPVDDALQFGHDEVVKVLKDYQQVYRQQEVQQHTEGGHLPKLDNIEGMV
uniref:glutaminase n=1 Tax=Echeneis naucrates TaxID=173247 RepID=A0A665V329_ECHNA